MTDQPQDGPTIEPKPAQVTPQAGTRLEQLHALYEEAKARKDEAEKALKAITDGIKSEVFSQLPEGATAATIAGQAGPPLAMTYVESWRLDSKRMKSEDPELYVRYAVKSGTWKLEKVRGQS
jgi:hypothetical protein